MLTGRELQVWAHTVDLSREETAVAASSTVSNSTMPHPWTTSAGCHKLAGADGGPTSEQKVHWWAAGWLPPHLGSAISIPEHVCVKDCSHAGCQHQSRWWLITDVLCCAVKPMCAPFPAVRKWSLSCPQVTFQDRLPT